MNICKIFIYLKYYYFFHKLLITLLLYKLHSTLFIKPSPILIKILYNDVQNNGCIIIKLIQWLHTRYDTFYAEKNSTSSKNLNVTNLDTTNLFDLLQYFNNIYEKCNIHKLDYTKQLFEQDFSTNLYNIIKFDSTFNIKSGSIAQVYRGKLLKTNKEVAIKVIHPNLNEQMLFPYLYFLLYNLLTNKISILQKYRIPFEMTSFFDNFYKQIDMKNEAKNLNYFYEEYKNNPLILIPKPIEWSNNILIMEYIEGTLFTELTVSDYIKHKIIMILNLFVKNGMFLCNIYHADLHNSNWKVIIENNSPKLVIYDFGFCITTNLNINKETQNLHKSIDTNNKKLFAECLYKCIEHNPYKLAQTEFIQFLINYIDNNNYNLYNSKSLKLIITYFIKNKFIFKSDILDALTTLLLIDNHLKKYLYIDNVNNEIVVINDNYINKKLKNLHNQLTTYKSFCKTNDCFNKLQDYFTQYIKEVEDKLNNITDIKKYKKNRENIKYIENKKNKENIKYRKNETKTNIEI